MDFGKTLNGYYKHPVENCLVLQIVPFGNDKKRVLGRVNCILGYSLDYNFVLAEGDDIIETSSSTYCDVSELGSTFASIGNDIPNQLARLKDRIPNSEIKVNISINRNFFFKNNNPPSRFDEFYFAPDDLKQLLFLNIKKHLEISNDPYNVTFENDDFLRMGYTNTISKPIILSTDTEQNEMLDTVKKIILEDIEKFEKIRSDNENAYSNQEQIFQL